MNRKGVPQHHYTEEERMFLKEHSPCFTRTGLTDAFNETFGLKQSVQSIKSICSTLGYKCSNDGKFKKGQSSWCRGIGKEEWLSHLSDEKLKNMQRGQYGHGRERDRGYPIGHELWRNGYIMVKVNDDKDVPANQRWIQKHNLLWEQFHKKKVPEGCIVIFKDGDRTNFHMDNLLLISRSQSSVLAKWNGFCKGEMTETYAKAAKLLVMANRKESDKSQKDSESTPVSDCKEQSVAE